jgi:phosphoglycolate phosphatase
MYKLKTPQGSHSISAILFDKDGTLLQFVSLWGFWGDCLLNQFTENLEQRGITIQVEHFPAWLGTVHNRQGNIIDYDRNGPLAMGTMEDLYAILSWQCYRLGLSWAESMELVHRCNHNAEAMMEERQPALPLPGLLSFLDECKSHGVPLAVVTADETSAAEKHLGWLGIRQYFSEVIGTDQVTHGKPFPDMVELACQTLTVDPSQVAVIGDTNGDMRMAKAAHATVAIGISATPDANTALSILPDADIIIQSYADLRIEGLTHED